MYFHCILVVHCNLEYINNNKFTFYYVKYDMKLDTGQNHFQVLKITKKIIIIIAQVTLRKKIIK